MYTSGKVVSKASKRQMEYTPLEMLSPKLWKRQMEYTLIYIIEYSCRIFHGVS